MPINPNIILEATRDMPNLGETYVNAFEAGRKASAENHKAERANKFASLQANIPQGVDRTKYLSSQGYAEEALAMDKSEAEIGKLKAEGGVKDLERLEKIKSFGGKVFQYIAAHPSPTREVVAQALDDAANNGEIPLDLYQQSKAGLANMPSDPEEIRALARARVMELTAPKDQMQFVQPDANAQLGAQTQMRGQDITQQNNLANQGLNREEFGFNKNKFNKEFGFNKEQEKFRQANDEAKFSLDQDKFVLDQDKFVLDKDKQRDSKGQLKESQQKQVLGARNLHNAIKEYTGQLQNWSNWDLFSPSQQAEMGTIYNNMLLQAKEAYNLGVLNGQDYGILQKIVTDPRSMKGAVTPNSGLEKQAKELDRIMSGVAQTTSETISRGQGGFDVGPGSWGDAAINAEAQKRGKSPESIRAYLKARGMMQ